MLPVKSKRLIRPILARKAFLTVSMTMSLTAALTTSESSARDFSMAGAGELGASDEKNGSAGSVGQGGSSTGEAAKGVRTPCRDGRGRWQGPTIVLEKVDSNRDYLFHKFVFNLGSTPGCVMDPAEAVFSLYYGDKKVFDITSILREGAAEPWVSWFLISDCSRSESEKRGGGHSCVLLRVNRQAFFGGERPKGELSIEIVEDGKKFGPLKLKIKSK